MKMKTNTKFFALLILAVVSLISVAAVGSALLPYNDGFEYSTLQSNSWVIGGNGGNNWTIGNNPNTGSNNAEASPGDNSQRFTAFMQKNIPTTGYTNIRLTYALWLGDTFESGDGLNVSWSSDGNTFNEVDFTNLTSSDYVSSGVISLPASATDKAGFVIRFECSTNAQTEFCRIDDIKMEGDQISQNSNLTITVDTPTVRFGQNATITIRNTGSDSLDILMDELTTFGALFSDDSFTLSGNGGSNSIIIILDKLTNLEFGDNAVNIEAKDFSKGISKTATINVQKGFCSQGPKGGNLSINSFDITNNGEGDENSWQLLDEIEIEFDVENLNSDDDANDVFAELALYDNEGRNQASDLDFEEDDEEIDLGDIDSDNEETVTFRFRVPADFDTTTNYKLAVKAYGDDVGEDEECTDVFDSNKLFEDISVDTVDDNDEGKFIAFENSVVSPIEATCGDIVTLSTDVFNVGDNDEDRVRVNLMNTELGLNDFFEIRNTMETGDRETVNFDFTLPQGLENKIYQLRLSADYDFSGGDYDKSSDEDTLVPLKVLGCSGSGDGSGNGESFVDIEADLDSDAVAGQELVVRATITNLGEEDATFAVSALDYQSWASDLKVSERLLDLGPGESKEVTFTFTINDDVEGEQTFVIETSSTSGTETREVAVNVEGSQGGRLDLGNNGLLWIIGIVNIILIILIIIVAVRVSRR